MRTATCAEQRAPLKRKKGDPERVPFSRLRVGLFDVPGSLLPVAFLRQRLFRAPLLARFQIVGVSFDLFDDVFGLNLALETPESAFHCLSILQMYFCQFIPPPSHWHTPGRLFIQLGGNFHSIVTERPGANRSSQRLTAPDLLFGILQCMLL